MKMQKFKSPVRVTSENLHFPSPFELEKTWMNGLRPKSENSNFKLVDEQGKVMSYCNLSFTIENEIGIYVKQGCPHFNMMNEI